MPLTKLDWFEKVAQTAYTGMCLLAPEFWVTDNYLGQKVNPTMIALTRLIGMLCFCITMMTYVVRSNDAAKPILADFDIATGVAWGVRWRSYYGAAGR